jgi:AmmeMemoRadiSam system protein B/AmmeMemoRadiSam system protein A
MSKKRTRLILAACLGLVVALAFSLFMAAFRPGGPQNEPVHAPTSAVYAEEPKAEAHSSEVREPAVAGAFYPGDPKELEAMVDGLLKKAEPKPLPGKAVALLVPHAGYVFSGETAVYGYNAVKGDWKTVVLIGAGHRYRVNGAALYHRGAFRTPLGDVPINEKLCVKLLKESPYILDLPKVHDGEHSVEVQVPFLQRLTKDFSIAPMIMNMVKPETCEIIGQAIARALKDENALIVISSDLSHFPKMNDAQMVDQTTLRALQFMDPSYFRLTCDLLMKKDIEELGCTYCGDTALLTGQAAAMALGADRGVLIRYMNSGEIPRIGDPSRVVGYGAFAFVKTGEEGLPSKHQLGDAEKKQLRELARNTIKQRLDEKPVPKLPVFENSELNLPAAVFVTLTKGGVLRGCIGCLGPTLPLAEALQQYAQEAAFSDHRFPPVAQGELEKLEIEISILSPLRRVKSAESIEPKKHGVVVKQGRSSGLFLPQVWEKIPEKEQFLGELCEQKAGLSRKAWQDPKTELYIFTVEAF